MDLIRGWYGHGMIRDYVFAGRMDILDILGLEKPVMLQIPEFHSDKKGSDACSFMQKRNKLLNTFVIQNRKKEKGTGRC
jgi:hypothetical protein